MSDLEALKVSLNKVREKNVIPSLIIVTDVFFNRLNETLLDDIEIISVSRAESFGEMVLPDMKDKDFIILVKE